MAGMAEAAQKALESADNADNADNADDAVSADAGNADGRSDHSPDRSSDRSPDRASDRASDRSRAAMEAATVLIDGRRYMRDGRGRLTPLALVRPQDQLMDEMVRIIVGHAEELSAQIARFRGHTMDDISAFDALLEAEYGGHARRSVKGNRTYLSYDGCFKVQVQIAERIAFGPELQVARELVDHCIGEWSASANDEIRALVNHAFQADREGEISRGAIYSLLAARYRRRALEEGDGRAARCDAHRRLQVLCARLPPRRSGSRLGAGHHRPGESLMKKRESKQAGRHRR